MLSDISENEYNLARAISQFYSTHAGSPQLN